MVESAETSRKPILRNLPFDLIEVRVHHQESDRSTEVIAKILFFLLAANNFLSLRHLSRNFKLCGWIVLNFV